MTHISVMVYFTPAFRAFVASPESKKYSQNPWTDPIRHIKRQIAHANLIFEANEIPVTLVLHCIEELKDFLERSYASPPLYAPSIQLNKFRYSKKGLKPLLNSANIAILMTGAPTLEALGCAGTIGPSRRTNKPPIAWVFPQDDLTLVHEIGHIFGCHHNREASGKNGGYLLKKSNMFTIMAYPDETHVLNIPYFSSNVMMTKDGTELGDRWNDNRRQIIKNRFLLSQYNKESNGNCRHHKSSCKDNCDQDCCHVKEETFAEPGLQLCAFSPEATLIQKCLSPSDAIKPTSLHCILLVKLLVSFRSKNIFELD